VWREVGGWSGESHIGTCRWLQDSSAAGDSLLLDCCGFVTIDIETGPTDVPRLAPRGLVWILTISLSVKRNAHLLDLASPMLTELKNHQCSYYTADRFVFFHYQ
jgi:hypothetical protein